ncbi:aminoglycoside phosphotransferase family protein [Janthinobacterium sp. LB2P49]|uniref:aminoglycoside phosphotransferase family protein n=1 Tax=Janthinobacterium sp. LB2P49 TaxID=3424198 RepID=UPI003F2302E8
MDYQNRIADYFRQWSLRADGVPVLQGGQPAMLKLSTGDDERRAGAVLRWWDGDGTVRVLAASSDDDVLLLERAMGSRSLAALAGTGEAGDAAATGILCAVASRLHAPRPSAPPLPPLSGCFAALAAATALAALRA